MEHSMGRRTNTALIDRMVRTFRRDALPVIVHDVETLGSVLQDQRDIAEVSPVKLADAMGLHPDTVRKWGPHHHPIPPRGCDVVNLVNVLGLKLVLVDDADADAVVEFVKRRNREVRDVS